MYNSKKIVKISFENLEKISGGADIIEDAINLAKKSVKRVEDAYSDVKSGQNGFFNGIFKTYGYEYVTSDIKVKNNEQEDKNGQWKFSSKNFLNFSNIFGDNTPNLERAGSATGFGIVVISGNLVLKLFKKVINTIC